MRSSLAAGLVVVLGLGSATAAETAADQGCEPKDIQAAIVEALPQLTACHEGDLTQLLPTTRIEPMTADARAMVPFLGRMPFWDRRDVDPTSGDWPFSRMPSEALTSGGPAH